MSEPEAGTDVLGMKTKAEYDSSRNTWVLNGTKLWITNGTLNGTDTGDMFLIYARTGPKRTDLTSFIVEKGMEGFQLGQQIKDKCGMRASPTAELVLKDVYVPAQTHVVGEVNGATLCMMRNLEIERVALAAMAIGIARRCIDEMVSYSKERKAFGKTAIEFGQVQKAISEVCFSYVL